MWLTGCAAIGDVVLPADPLAARLAEQLDRDGWRVDPDWSAAGDPLDYRWQFAAGKTPAELPFEPPAELPSETVGALTSLAGRADRVGWNATILLARHQPSPSIIQTLAVIVRGGDSGADVPGRFDALASRFGSKTSAAGRDAIPTSIRSAAAETWCRALAAGDGTIEARLAEPGRTWRREELPAAVRAELIRGLARHLPPERIVGYGDLFPVDAASQPDELRRAAIDGCLLFAGGRESAPFSADDWPPTIGNANSDPDSVVRRRYGRWLAVAGHPGAAARLRDQLEDIDPNVARSAVRSLGLVHGDEAHTLLLEVSQNPAETLRAAAVESLAAWGPDELESFLDDESVYVRRAAVSALSGWPSAASAVLLDTALSDRDLDVQRRAVSATAGWPDEFALPVLLSGLENAAARTRRECLGELRRRTGFEESLPITGERDERSAAIRELAAKHGWPLDSLTRFRLATAKNTADASSDVTPRADVATLLASLAEPDRTAAECEPLLAALRTAGTAAVPAIEAFCGDQPGPIADRLSADVLPAISESHAALAELGSGDVAIRRRAAGRLAELGRSATLSPLALRRLHALLLHEQDGLVWRQAMATIAADATPDAERIALLAVNNTWPDVRRLGCEYVGRHGRSQQAAWLLPLLDDENDAVRLAAIEAVGRCGSPALLTSASGEAGSPGRLHAAAVDRNREIRLAALTALARLGDEAGGAALLRWAEYESPSERLKAVRAIASTGRRRFEQDLARLAWMERDATVRRELLSGLEALVPADQRPSGADAASVEDRLAAWASRWEGRPASSTMTPR